MATKIKVFRSETTGATPGVTTPDDLGEIAINVKDRKLFARDSSGAPVLIASGIVDYAADRKYAVGDFVIQAAAIQQCTVAVSTPEAFDPAKWRVVGGDSTDGVSLLPTSPGRNTIDTAGSPGVEGLAIQGDPLQTAPLLSIEGTAASDGGALIVDELGFPGARFGASTWRQSIPGHGFTAVGQVVAYDNGWELARANDADRLPVAFLQEIIDANTVVLRVAGLITDLSPLAFTGGAIAEGRQYYISSSVPGQLTLAQPPQLPAPILLTNSLTSGLIQGLGGLGSGDAARRATSGDTFPVLGNPDPALDFAPVVGDMHYLSTGTVGLYIFYEDVDGGQWVQTNGSYTDYYENDKPVFNDVAELQANEATFDDGTVITTRAEGFAYVADSTLAASQLPTASATKLRVLPSHGVANVLAFGAALDGVADDAAAMNRAIAQADGGGEIVVPDGVMRVTPQGTLASIGGAGTGAHSYIFNLKDRSGIKVTFYGSLLIENGADRADLFYLDGSADIDIGGFDYEINGSEQCDIVQAFNTERVTFVGTNCTGGTGIVEALVTAQTSNKEWLVTGHTLPAAASWRAGVAFYDSAQNVTIRDNVFEDGEYYYCVDIENMDANAYGIRIINNTCRNVAAAAIKSSANDTIITGNLVDGVSSSLAGDYTGQIACINLLDVDGFVIEENICKNASTYGIHIERSVNGTIGSNVAQGNGGGSLALDPTTTAGDVENIKIDEGNTFRDAIKVVYLRVEQLINVQNLLTDDNRLVCHTGHLANIGSSGATNPVFTEAGTNWSRVGSRHPYGQLSLQAAPGMTDFSRVVLDLVAQHTAALAGKTFQLTLNYKMDADYAGSARVRWEDFDGSSGALNDYSVVLPVVSEPTNITLTFACNNGAVTSRLSIYSRFGADATQNLYLNYLTIGSARQDPNQNRFANTLPNVLLQDGAVAYNPGATVAPFSYIVGGGAWRNIT